MRRYNAFSPVTANLQVHSRYAYDSAGRLTSLTHGRTLIAGGESWNGTSTVPASLTPSTLLAAYSYSYDTANRITSMSSYRDAFKAAYTYDDTDQLTTVTNTAISGMTPPFTVPTGENYLLDANGNRKSSSGASQSATGTQNRLQTDGTYNYIYDAEGNTTQRTLIATGAVTDYGHTYKNWLASVTERASAGGAMTKRTEFVYDAFGQGVGKRVDSDGNGTWDRHEAYVWADGQEVLRLVDADGDGTAQPFRLANRYLYAGAVDELLADEQFTGNSGPAVNATSGNATAGNTLYPLTDHLGSVRDLIDNSGVNRQHVVYDSFGRRTLEVDYNASGAQIANNDPAAIDELFGYTGRDWDTDVGLQYNRARWYNPSTGRWLNQDPIGFAAGDANLYRYVGNEATGATDPSGLWGEPYSGSVFGPDSFLGRAWGRVGSHVAAMDPRLIPGNLASAWDQLDDDFLVVQQMIYAPNDYLKGRTQAGKQFVNGIAEKCSTPGGAGELYVDTAMILIARKIALSAAAKTAGTSATAANAGGLGLAAESETITTLRMVERRVPASNPSLPIRPVVSILERDGNVILGEINIGSSKLQFLANESVQGKTLILDKLHIQEAGGTRIMNKVGRPGLLDAARAYGKQCGVDEVIVQGGARASKTVTTPTGKVIVKPARVPEPIKIRVGED